MAPIRLLQHKTAGILHACGGHRREALKEFRRGRTPGIAASGIARAGEPGDLLRAQMLDVIDDAIDLQEADPSFDGMPEALLRRLDVGNPRSATGATIG